jgi:small-conductance mechanosensitive channel/CRP-like cAMP-binding protein
LVLGFARLPNEDALWLTRPWLPIALGAALILLAFVLGRLAPARRRTLGRAAILYVAYLVTIGFAAVFAWIGREWLARCAVFGSGALEVLLFINLAAIVLFDLVLPALHLGMADIVSDVVIGASYALAFLWVMHRAGVEMSGIVATSAVVTGVLGLSLQATLGNVVGGLALQLDDSIRVGDWIELESKVQGRVRQVRWRHTVVETRDWDTLIVPNATLLAQTVKILGKREGAPLQHRMWVYFNVDFRHAPGTVIDVVNDALRAAPISGVAKDPPPECVCFDFAREGRDSFAYYAARYWLSDLLHDDATNSIVRSRIYSALRREGIPLALPGTAIFLSQDDPEHARRKREREQAARVAALGGVELFDAMTAEEKESLAERMRHVPFSRGEVIMRQGAEAHRLYILTNGEAQVRVLGKDGEKTVATIEAPSFFGEMGLMTGEPRSATVVAVTDVDCYRIDKEDFHGILSQRPEIADAISAVLAQRRIDLIAAQKDMDDATRRSHLASERESILAAIESFFGLRG